MTWEIEIRAEAVEDYFKLDYSGLMNKYNHKNRQRHQT